MFYILLNIVYTAIYSGMRNFLQYYFYRHYYNNNLEMTLQVFIIIKITLGIRVIFEK